MNIFGAVFEMLQAPCWVGVEGECWRLTNTFCGVVANE